MSRENRITSSFALAAAALALGEGAAASGGSWEVSPAAGLLAFAEVAGILAAPSLVLALVLGAFASRREVRALGRAVVKAAEGDEPRARGWAIALELALLGVFATWSSILARHAVERTSAHVAALVSVAAGACAVAASVVVAAALGPPAWRFAGRLAPRLPAVVRRAVPAAAPLLTLAAVLVGMHQLLPAAYYLPLALALLTFAVARTHAVGARIALVTRDARGLGAVSFGFAASAVAFAVLPAAPPDTKLALLYRAPLASSFLEAVRALVDADSDGYSPILLGGDCDDDDAAVHPGAADLPGDGVDQNCTGGDARAFVPAREVEGPPPPAPLSVVIVHFDALRPDHLGMSGYARPTSPNLDRFRQTATWFEDAYTPAPGTRFAMASVFTGLEVERVPRRAGPGLDFTLSEDARTIAEELQDRGYDTVGFTLSEVAQHIHGIGQGFRVWKTPWPKDEPPYAETAERTTDAALSYLATATQPYLLFAHYGCTHEPYVKHAEHDFGDRPVDVYDSALAHCDAELGRLFAALDARADRDRTAVIVYSDHGELFGEHGFDHHGTTLYQPDVRVLLMAKVPGGRAGAVVRDPVTLTDIGPTVLALAGAPQQASTSAWSLLPYARGDAPGPARPVFLYAEVYNGPVHFEAQGVVVRGCKLVRYAPSGTEQLFDSSADPAERRAQTECNGEPAGYFRDLLDGWSAYVQPESPRQPAHEVGME